LNAVVDALACYEIERRQIQVLSLKCGDTSYKVDEEGGPSRPDQVAEGHKTAMRVQSLNAGQTYLLIGMD
jgi:hypothetical protein